MNVARCDFRRVGNRGIPKHFYVSARCQRRKYIGGSCYRVRLLPLTSQLLAMGNKGAKHAALPSYSDALAGSTDAVSLYDLRRSVRDQLWSIQSDFELLANISPEYLSGQIHALLEQARYPYKIPADALLVLPAAVAWLNAYLEPKSRTDHLKNLLRAWDEEILKPVPNRCRLRLLAEQMQRLLRGCDATIPNDFDVMTKAREALEEGATKFF